MNEKQLLEKAYRVISLMRYECEALQKRCSNLEDEARALRHEIEDYWQEQDRRARLK